MIQISDSWSALKNQLCCMALGKPLPTHSGPFRENQVIRNLFLLKQTVYYSYSLNVFPGVHAITGISCHWKVQCVQWMLKWVTDIRRECLRLSLSAWTSSLNQVNKHFEHIPPSSKGPSHQKYFLKPHICGKKMTNPRNDSYLPQSLWKEKAA